MSSNSRPDADIAHWREGGCHCGAVRFRVRPRGRRVIECNCSICSKKGFLGLIVPPEDFELLCGEENLGRYRFNTRVAEHRFCKTCGIHPYSRPRSHPDGFDVNLRCLDGGIGGFAIDSFDGEHWEENVGSIRKNSLSLLFTPFATSITTLLTIFSITIAIAATPGCDASFVEAGPGRECLEVAAQCVLEKGPLGVCEQTRCADGESGPCLVCTPQH